MPWSRSRRANNPVVVSSLQDDRNDRRLRQPSVIAKRAQTTPQKIRIVLDFGHPLRLLLQNRQTFTDGRHRSRTQSRGKNKRRCPMLKIDGKFMRHSSKTTSGGNGLSQRTSPDVYLLVAMPKCSSVPRPHAPITPEACDSSTSRKKPNSFLTSRISGRWQTSPSMEKTPSEMTKVRLAWHPFCSSWRKDEASLCRNRCNCTPANRHASVRLRWQSESMITRSAGPSSAPSTGHIRQIA